MKCGHYITSRRDGVRCPKCNGGIIPLGEATNADINKNNEIIVSIKLEGIENIKSDLKEVEERLDRILEKKSKLNELTRPYF